MKQKFYIRKITWASGLKEYQVIREYSDGRSMKHLVECGRYNAIFIGKFLAKKKMQKLIKFYKKYDLADKDYFMEKVVE